MKIFRFFEIKSATNVLCKPSEPVCYAMACTSTITHKNHKTVQEQKREGELSDLFTAGITNNISFIPTAVK